MKHVIGNLSKKGISFSLISITVKDVLKIVATLETKWGISILKVMCGTSVVSVVKRKMSCGYKLKNIDLKWLYF